MTQDARMGRRNAPTAEQTRALFQSRLNAWRAQQRDRQPRTSHWKKAQVLSGSVWSLLLKLPFAVALVIIVAIFVQGVMRETTVIEPISVPKALADDGYTPDVAARHLRDAIMTFVAEAKSNMRAPDLALQGELPNLVVPTVGVSLDAMTAAVRSFFQSTRSRSIAGEITHSNGQLRLRWRIDGGKNFTTPAGIAADKPGELFAAAAEQIVGQVRPYLVASRMYDRDKDASISKADEIIAIMPETDDNVAWAYVLKSKYHIDDTKNFIEAERHSKKAVDLQPANLAAQGNLAHSWRGQGRFDEAYARFSIIHKMNPKDVQGKTGMARVHLEKREYDKAIKMYLEVIEMDRFRALSHFNLAYALEQANKPVEAMDRYKISVLLDPNAAYARNNYGAMLEQNGHLDQAIVQYRAAIDVDKNFAMTHRNLGLAYKRSGKPELAIAALREALKLDPAEAWVKDELRELERIKVKAAPPDVSTKRH